MSDFGKPYLSEQNYQQLETARKILNDTLPLLDKAERCGIDCQQHRQVHQVYSEVCDNLKTEFFPDKTVGSL